MPKKYDAIIPVHVPIWHNVPREPLYFVGATYETVVEGYRLKEEIKFLYN